jgi:hypothetical protein
MKQQKWRIINIQKVQVTSGSLKEEIRDKKMQENQ